MRKNLNKNMQPVQQDKAELARRKRKDYVPIDPKSQWRYKELSNRVRFIDG